MPVIRLKKKGDKMRINQRISLVILLAICLTFLSQTIFAQNIKDLNSEIYSKLKCCKCSVSFTTCTCQHAKEMKAYISSLIESNVPVDDIFYKVAKKFTLDTIIDKQVRDRIEKRIINESGGKRPQAVLESASFNLGTVSKKQGIISKTFKLYNKGNDVLVVKNLKTSCACVTAAVKIGKNKSAYFGTTGAPSDWQVQINPGKSADIEVAIDLKHHTVNIGRLIREIYISTNDLLNPEITIRLEVEVTD